MELSSTNYFKVVNDNTLKQYEITILKFIATIFLMLLFSCANKKPAPADTVAMLKEMEQLGTVEYTVTKVVKANDNTSRFTLGQRKILITVEAFVKAGIDMKEITKDDISRSGKTITIRLPPPKILSVNLPPDKIKVEFEKVTLFRDPFTVKERDQLMVQAETQIRNSGIEPGIVDQAKINTQLVLSGLLLKAGFEKVVLTYDKTTGNKQ